jgi:hypothetical protein
VLSAGSAALVALIALAVGAGLGRAGVSAVHTFSVTGAVAAIAADGPRVAIAVRNPAGCDRAVVWTAPGTAAQTYASKVACAGVVFHGITEIAVAGNRVEWVATAGGNLQDMNLEAATVGRPQISQVAFGENQAGAEGGIDGDWIGHVYGDGTLLVYNTWHECTLSRRQGAPSCGPGVPIGGIFYSKQTLWKLVGLTKARIRSGEDAYATVAVDGGRVALQGVRDGAVIVVDQHGHRITSAAITAGSSAGTAMQGTQVVTLRGTNLQLWDASSGHLNGSVTLPAGTGASLLQDLQRAWRSTCVAAPCTSFGWPTPSRPRSWCPARGPSTRRSSPRDSSMPTTCRAGARAAAWSSCPGSISSRGFTNGTKSSRLRDAFRAPPSVRASRVAEWSRSASSRA